MAAVPIGLTRYREGLEPLEAYDRSQLGRCWISWWPGATMKEQ